MISSACARASFSRSRYSCSSSSASVRVRSAVSIDSSMPRLRRSSASEMRGNASFESSTIVIPKTSSVQIIRPMPGLIRKLPFDAASTTEVGCTRAAGIALDDERGQQAGDEAVEEASLGQGEAEPLQLRDLVAHLRLTRDRFDRLAEDDADADAGADCAESSTNTESDRLAGLGDFFGRCREDGD